MAACASTAYPVTVRVSPGLIPYLPLFFSERIHDSVAQAGPPEAAGWITLTLQFESLFAARERILGLGSTIEVVEPQPLRQSIADFAAQTVARHAQ